MTDFPTHLNNTMTLRSIFGTFAYVMMTYAISYLPISIYEIINNTSPFFVSIIAYFVLKEKLLLRQAIGMGIAFIGVIILVSTKSKSERMKAFDKYYVLGIILSIGYALLFSTV